MVASTLLCCARSQRKILQALSDMRCRCLNPLNKDFAHYGGRGITICHEWLADKYEFVRWSLANGFESGLTIDRIDNDRGYSPDNCRWVSRRANNLNRSLKQRTTSHFAGVSFQKSIGKWRAMSRANGRDVYLGSFLSELEAAKAYDKFVLAEFNDPSLLNFPA